MVCIANLLHPGAIPAGRYHFCPDRRRNQNSLVIRTKKVQTAIPARWIRVDESQIASGIGAVLIQILSGVMNRDFSCK